MRAKPGQFPVSEQKPVWDLYCMGAQQGSILSPRNHLDSVIYVLLHHVLLFSVKLGRTSSLK